MPARTLFTRIDEGAKAYSADDDIQETGFRVYKKRASALFCIYVWHDPCISSNVAQILVKWLVAKERHWSCHSSEKVAATSTSSPSCVAALPHIWIIAGRDAIATYVVFVPLLLNVFWEGNISVTIFSALPFAFRAIVLLLALSELGLCSSAYLLDYMWFSAFKRIWIWKDCSLKEYMWFSVFDRAWNCNLGFVIQQSAEIRFWWLECISSSDWLSAWCTTRGAAVSKRHCTSRQCLSNRRTFVIRDIFPSREYLVGLQVRELNSWWF